MRRVNSVGRVSKFGAGSYGFPLPRDLKRTDKIMLAVSEKFTSVQITLDGDVNSV